MTSIAVRRFFNTLSRVQAQERTAHAMQGEIAHHLNNGAAVIQMMLHRTRGLAASEAFYDVAVGISLNAAEKAEIAMHPVIVEATRLNLSTMRLMSVVRMPELANDASLAELNAFGRTLKHTHRDLRRIRYDGELAMMQAGGLNPDEYRLF